MRFSSLRKFATHFIRPVEEIDNRTRSRAVRLWPVLLLLLAMPIAGSQKRAVDSRDRGYRIILVDRLVTDAKTGRTKPAHVDGLAFVLLAFHHDKKHVLIELAGQSYESF